jgi:hypothetical protein
VLPCYLLPLKDKKKEPPGIAVPSGSRLKPKSAMKTRKRIQGEVGIFIISHFALEINQKGERL